MWFGRVEFVLWFILFSKEKSNTRQHTHSGENDKQVYKIPRPAATLPSLMPELVGLLLSGALFVLCSVAFAYLTSLLGCQEFNIFSISKYAAPLVLGIVVSPHGRITTVL